MTDRPNPLSGGADRRPAELYQRAVGLAEAGRYGRAARLLVRLERSATDAAAKAVLLNDMGAVAAADGRVADGRACFARALVLDGGCRAAADNLATLDGTPRPSTVSPAHRPAPPAEPADAPVRVAILSLLFNWPSTGGGNVHTAELAQFLGRAGYDVRHLFARYEPWAVGRTSGPALPGSEAIDFDDRDWHRGAIQAKFRAAVDRFAPDYVIITDAWNFKPHLAEAVRGYPYFLRQQALECLCPLNNLRFLSGERRDVAQCPFHQLARPDACHQCLGERGARSGALHKAERALSGVGTPEYDASLRRAVAEAEAVLVLNPLLKEMFGPYARDVRVVTWGMDAARFPWPPPDPGPREPGAPTRLFMAGLVHEGTKGYHVLHEACGLLWRKRQDFELVVTGDPPGPVDEYTRFVGWLSQDELPAQLRAADVLVMPTIAQEGLGRTTVEAMAVGRPVVASRIGGLPYTVADGATGLLCEPGDAGDLADKIEVLLDDPPLRERMGLAGRRRFEREFTWDVVIDTQYRPLLTRRRRGH